MWNSKLKSIDGGVMKVRLKMSKVLLHRPETKWANHEQVEDSLTAIEGLNPHLWKKMGMICD